MALYFDRSWGVARNDKSTPLNASCKREMKILRMWHCLEKDKHEKANEWWVVCFDNLVRALAHRPPSQCLRQFHCWLIDGQGKTTKRNDDNMIRKEYNYWKNIKENQTNQTKSTKQTWDLLWFQCQCLRSKLIGKPQQSSNQIFFNHSNRFFEGSLKQRNKHWLHNQAEWQFDWSWSVNDEYEQIKSPQVWSQSNEWIDHHHHWYYYRLSTRTRPEWMALQHWISIVWLLHLWFFHQTFQSVQIKSNIFQRKDSFGITLFLWAWRMWVRMTEWWFDFWTRRERERTIPQVAFDLVDVHPDH